MESQREKKLRGRLKVEAELIARRYGEASYDQKDYSWLFVNNFPVPEGWNRSKAAILIDIPTGSIDYPQQAPHWFWTDKDLATADGRSIGHFFLNESGADKYSSQGWGHFCIHVNDWRPSSGGAMQSGHSLMTYLDLIALVFRDKQTLVN